MLTTQLAPLRTSVGKAFRIRSVQLVAHSPLLDPANIHAVVRASPAEVTDSADHAGFLPAAVLLSAGNAPLLGDEARGYTMPSDLPFPGAGGFVSIYIRGPGVDNVLDSRQFWAEFEIEFQHEIQGQKEPGEPRMGGVLLGGLPYLPSYLNDQGEPSANHGLPRELRLTWRDKADDGFIDDEMSITRQVPAWQSNYHVVDTGPVVTNRLRLRLSDLPRLLDSLRSWDPVQGTYAEYWGAVIPFLYVFQYRERTRYQPQLPAGVVAAVQSNVERPRSFFAPALASDFAEAWRGADSTYLHLHNNQHVYPFTPQSAMLPQADRRRYSIAPGGNRVEEFFVSNRLDAGDRLWLYVAQREEHERTVAGLKIAFASSKLDEVLDLAPGRPLRLRVWEIDRLPGSPVAEIKPDLLRDRYTRLLADERLAETRDVERTIRFDRPSLARNFCIALEAEDKTQVSIQHLALVQSAFVSVAPRASRSQMVRTLHFRLVGQNLGNDLAALGGGGFHVAVDRIVAGEVRERLFYAHSLEGLMRSGAVRLMANSRVRATERQTTMDLTGYTETTSESRNRGWNRSESGEGVAAPAQWSQAGSSMTPDGEHGFRQMRNEEARMRVRHVANVPKAFRDRMAPYFPQLNALLAPSGDLLWQDGARGWWAPWRALTRARRTALGQALAVDGLLNVSIPPYHSQLMTRTVNNGGLDNLGAIQAALSQMIAELFLTNGAGIGTSMGASAVVANWSWSNNISASGVASALSAHSMGTTGSITLSASESGYAYAQSLTASANEGQTRTQYLDGQQQQVSIRSEALGTEYEQLRLRGAEVMWEGQITDVAIGQMNLGIVLPATNEPAYRTTDDAIRVSFGKTGEDLTFDVWFDIEEELVRDDY